jgi:hypothetical protein
MCEAGPGYGCFKAHFSLGFEIFINFKQIRLCSLDNVHELRQFLGRKILFQVELNKVFFQTKPKLILLQDIISKEYTFLLEKREIKLS